MRKPVLLLLALCFFAVSSLEARRRWVPKMASGPNSYFYSQAQGSGTPADTFSTSLYALWAPISITGGTANKISVYCSAFGVGSNIKLALYDSGGTQIAAPSPSAVAGVGWIDATVSVSVSTGTVYVGWIQDTVVVAAFERDSAGTDCCRSADTQTYAGGMPGSLPANGNPPGGQPTVRIFVQ